MIPASEQDTELDPKVVMETWDRFFLKYGYRDQISKIGSEYPDTKTLYVSYRHISEFDSNFSSLILEYPEVVLSLGEQLIREEYISPGKKVKNRRFNIRLTEINLRETLHEIRDLRASHVGKLVSVTGIVRKNTEVMPRLYYASFQCSNCGHVMRIRQERGRLEEPQVCEGCGEDRHKVRFRLDLSDSEFVDSQKIEIQENPETLEGGAQPQRITIILEDDITGKIFPGDRVTVDGILKAEQKRAGNTLLTEFYTYIYAINYRKESKEVEDIHITEEDEQKIKEMARDPNIIEKLAKSIAPTIYGLEMVKTCLVLQMFGGVRKTMKDGTTMRGDIHILMVGDPGTAKSQLLKYMTEISPRSVFAFGRGSSAAGLTAAAVRDEFGEGRWTLEAGALVLADNGFAAIDELDKMDEKDTAAMHEAMEQQTVTISKAGIMATLKSRCSILGAANPKFGRYDPNRTIVDQINFPPPLLSRFDVIFKIIDRPDRNTDEKLADHVLRAHRVGEIYRSLEQSEQIDMEIPEEEGFKPPFDKEMIRKYVAYAKSHIVPRLSDEAIELLREEYVKTRTQAADSIPITARQLESTIRLAEAAAKARLSPIVTAQDAMLAKKIVDFYLRDVSASNGQVDIDILLSGTTSRQRNELEMVYDAIKEIKSQKRVVEVEDVVALCVSRGMQREKVEQSIIKLKNMGQIYEPSYNRLDVIGRG
ncbi:ATPase AAA [Thermogymnomonas acidicola]|uniref:DNA helicase n=1 Tax=Thermogymnomonas acidicola TaxID=399579 RepID=A0AA37F9L8_9ARCH|nr:minichromosome maintenance protein MCM [Thermogymnomonas acidicola]GGM74059.1 ATPase AAA [Thermogymnomonas acidicola]